MNNNICRINLDALKELCQEEEKEFETEILENLKTIARLEAVIGRQEQEIISLKEDHIACAEQMKNLSAQYDALLKQNSSLQKELKSYHQANCKIQEYLNKNIKYRRSGYDFKYTTKSIPLLHIDKICREYGIRKGEVLWQESL
mgnify:CR=1 FL=1